VELCEIRVEDLPESPLFERGDARLTGDHLLVVRKGERRLMLFQGGVLAGPWACWRLGLGAGAPAGHKQVEGDRKTPEGWYRTSDKPISQHAGAIAIHYPSFDDARDGLADGRIAQQSHAEILFALALGLKPPQQTALGGQILIHAGDPFTDSTLGCVALSEEDLYELRAALPEGMATDILLLP